MKLFNSQLKEINLNNFSNLKFFLKSKHLVTTEMYCYKVEKAYNEFERRFEGNSKLQLIIIFMSFLFPEANDIEDISSQISHFFDIYFIKIKSEVLKIKYNIP